MVAAVKPIPEGYHSVTPYLILSGAGEAIAFYKKALGAEEVLRMDGPGGKIHHAEIRIGDSHIMLAGRAP
jgi:PhnB protein